LNALFFLRQAAEAQCKGMERHPLINEEPLAAFVSLTSIRTYRRDRARRLARILAVVALLTSLLSVVVAGASFALYPYQSHHDGDGWEQIVILVNISFVPATFAAHILVLVNSMCCQSCAVNGGGSKLVFALVLIFGLFSYLGIFTENLISLIFVNGPLVICVSLELLFGATGFVLLVRNPPTPPFSHSHC